MTSVTRGSPSRNSTIFSALSQWRSIRTPSVLSPRWVRKASKGPATAPIAFWWKPIFSARSRSRTTTAPPTTSLCPPTYLVVEWSDHVGAERQRLLEVGGGEGVVDDQEGTGVVGDARQRLDVADREHRVGGRLDPDQLRPTWEDRGGHRVDVGHRRRAEVEAPDLGHLVEETEGAAVGVVGDDGVVAGPGEGPDDRVLGGEAGGEGKPALAVLHCRQGPLQRRPRRVGGAAVLIAAAQAPDTVLLVGAAGIDGRVDRPGHRVGFVASVDRTRVEPRLVGAFLGHDASVDPRPRRRHSGTAATPPWWRPLLSLTRAQRAVSWARRSRSTSCQRAIDVPGELVAHQVHRQQVPLGDGEGTRARDGVALGQHRPRHVDVLE